MNFWTELLKRLEPKPDGTIKESMHMTDKISYELRDEKGNLKQSSNN